MGPFACTLPTLPLSRSAPSLASLTGMLERKLVIVSGKGGVGKSAVAVALAIRAQRAGKRVLVSAMTDEVGTAIHLGADQLPYQPATFPGGIHAMAVRRAEALEEYLKVQLRVPQAAPTKTFSKVMQVLVDTAPGIREVISMGKPIFDTWQGRYDIVIVDAPPIGQLMSYLRAPAVVSDVVPTGGIKDQSGRMAESLRDPEHSVLALVTSPEELPAIETRAALDELAEENLITVGSVVANRILPDLNITAQRVTQLPDRPATAAAQHHIGLLALQETSLENLPIDVRLPYLFGVHTPAEVSAQLADAWEDAL